MTAPRSRGGWKRRAERSAQLGLLAADQLARKSTDPVEAASAITTREDYRAALDAVRAVEPRRRKTLSA